MVAFKKAPSGSERGKVKVADLPRRSHKKMKRPVGIIVHDTVTPLGGSKWWTRNRVVVW